MSKTSATPQENERAESTEREAPGHPLTQEIFGKLLKLCNELGDTFQYCDVVTADGDPRRITRHPTNRFLLKITGPRFTSELDPSDPETYRKFFILDGTLAEVSQDATDAGIARIKEKARIHNMFARMALWG